jgi:UDP-glucose 4-epimerase
VQRALVTGGAGFIGSHLVRRLRAAEIDVTVLDDFSSGSRANVSEEVRLVVGSVLDPGAVDSALEGVDACFHLAAIASVAKCNEELVASHAVNITGFVMILHGLQLRGLNIPLIYASSAAVYGSCADLPLKETARIKPLSPYGADKLACELHAGAAHEVNKLTSTGFRFFNVYGPGQDPSSPYSGVISKFADRLARRCPLTIFGDGLQSRDFVYVADVVEGLYRAAANPARGAEVLNICTGTQVTITELANTMRTVFDCPVEIEHAATLGGEVRHSRGDPTALEARFGYHPSTNLIDGLSSLKASLA